MTSADTVLGDDLRCSVQTAALAEDPSGTAGFARRVILVELPLPWPKKIDQHHLLTDADFGGDGTVKLLGIRSSEATELDRHRVIIWERTEPFRGFERTETDVARGELASLLSTVARRGPAAMETAVRPSGDLHDLLLCTHGSRDRCCGQLGTLLHLELDGTLGPNVRLWRTSHTGGHRFAPTAIHFPHGTTWASLTAELTTAIVRQSVPTHGLAEHYRGNLGINGRPAQIAEGRAFLDRGWPFLDQERTVDTDVDADGTVTATVRGDAGLHTVSLRPVDPIPVPPCGQPIEAAAKATPQYDVVAEINH